MSFPLLRKEAEDKKAKGANFMHISPFMMLIVLNELEWKEQQLKELKAQVAK